MIIIIFNQNRLRTFQANTNITLLTVIKHIFSEKLLLLATVTDLLDYHIWINHIFVSVGVIIIIIFFLNLFFYKFFIFFIILFNR